MKFHTLNSFMIYNNCFKTRRKALNHLLFVTQYIMILFFAIITIPLISGHAITKNSIESRPDMLCNVGDEHECVCSRTLGDLDGKYLPCNSFLEVKRLSVICIKMRHVNLNARLYTNESYQQYFRRRIANILSKYCEHQANECPGTTVALKQQRRKEQRQRLEERLRKENELNNLEDISIETKSSMLLEEDDEEPAFTKENVVILKVTFDERNRTNVYFVVTKVANIRSLSDVVTMEPTKIKYIMSAQIAPLSRVLGGIRIEQLRVAEIRRAYSNKKLIIAVSVIGISFMTCCFIAFIKLFRDHRKQKKAQIRKCSYEDKNTSRRNYGSCTEKFLPNYETPNGKLKTKSANNFKKSKEQRSTPTNLKPHIIVEPKDNEEDENINVDDIKQRSLRNLFKCDPSQLPREIPIEYESLNYEEKLNDNYIKYNKTILPTSDDDDAFYPSTTNSISPQAQHFQRESYMTSVVITPSVLISSQSNTLLTETNSNDNEIFDQRNQQNTLGIFGEFIERPLSRRGSRDSSPEQGAEECGSSREDTPLPLGDEYEVTESNKNKKHKEDGSLNNSIYNDKSKWSIGSNNNDYTKVYYPLSEDDGVLKQNHLPHSKLLTNNLCELNGNSVSTITASSDSEEDEDNINEGRVLDRHQYKRLQESPLPPTISTTSEFED